MEQTPEASSHGNDRSGVQKTTPLYCKIFPFGHSGSGRLVASCAEPHLGGRTSRATTADDFGVGKSRHVQHTLRMRPFNISPHL
ncbi:hypothetical protein CEP54_008253 [Fusarium duplospermum]|uniref:Uncharacterized protein n=1 Tax=Fusarium duplospermum TaxID=1325734 RepID=A0A428PWM3_9HYPO|nr:hypothetical protein CEP54_008253 [Fusarium duplospermum]